MKIALTITYDGTDFSGYQVQPNLRTVQSELESALFNLTGEKIDTIVSGRTDAGVHAKGQVVSFETNSTIPPERFYRALNVLLPPDLKAISSREVGKDFNARKSAKRKTYAYKMYVSDSEKPLKDRYAERIYPDLDMENMKKVASVFVGEHNFEALSASGKETLTSVRTIYAIDIERSGEDITVSVTGNGFLYNMVRILVGCLVKAGHNDFTVAQAREMLKSEKREMGGKTLPAKGLTLISVEYED